MTPDVFGPPIVIAFVVFIMFLAIRNSGRQTG
jgi:hypothetical protein